MARSRLKRHQNKQSKRRILLLSVVFVGLVVLLVTFGARMIEFIGNTALLVQGEDDISESNTVSVVQEPFLESIPRSTSESELVVDGSVLVPGGTVILYLNGEEYDSDRLGEETDFSFDVSLDEGENIIRARYELDGEQSDYSESVSVTYRSEPPTLEDVSPSDGDEFGRGDQRIAVSGKTDKDARVTVNGFRAFVDQDGEFSYMLGLEEGENKIKVIATNDAGIESEEEFIVRYSP